MLFSENSCRRVGALRVLSLGRKLKRTGWHNNSLWNCRSKSRRILLVKKNEKHKSHLSDTRNIPDRIKWIILNTRPTTSILLRSLRISQLPDRQAGERNHINCRCCLLKSFLCPVKTIARSFCLETSLKLTYPFYSLISGVQVQKKTRPQDENYWTDKSSPHGTIWGI